MAGIAEAELEGFSWAAKTIIGIANVIMEVLGRVGVQVRERIDINGDNAEANLLARRDGDLRKVRHISLADLYIRETTQNGRVCVNDCSNEANRTDIFTKVRSRQRLASKLQLVGLVDSQ